MKINDIMTEFIIQYFTPKSEQEKYKTMDPEQMSLIMKSWKVWSEYCGSHMVDDGTMLSNHKYLDSTGSKISDSEIVGYTIMQADSIERIEELLKNCPHIKMSDKSHIEIHEKIPMPKC